MAQLLPEDDALVDLDLAVLGPGHLITLQGTGRGPLEVDARDVVPASVAGALELLLGFQPVRGAAQVGADGGKAVEPLLGPDDPNGEFGLEVVVDAD